MPERVVLHVVPHTHWDREWYEPFEGYRFRLVKVVDSLLQVLEDDPAFRHFNFDGQTAAIEDYLEVRPPVEPVVAGFVAEGRLAVGPWRILMDEFLCSPETIVRNLRQGAETSARLGRRMELGYIPDSFGHIAQMPQILRLAGLGRACVWRGVPRAVDRTVFRWAAPDGTELPTLYLATSYSNAASLPETPEDLVARARRILGDLAPFRPGAVALAMNGTDHRAPEPHITELFAKANAEQDEIEFRLGSMEEYAAEAPANGDLPVWRGEMRSGARANLLPGVASARVGLKQGEFRASALLERYAEPLAALGGTDTGRLLDRAWRAMVENSAHDSICGCGIDEVAAQVAARYAEAARVAELVATDGLEHLAARVDTSALGPLEGVVCFNPSPRPRAGVVEVTLTPPGSPGALAFRAPDGTVVPAQVLETREQVAVDMRLSGAQLARIVPTVHSRTIGSLYVNGLEVEGGRTTTVRLRMGPAPEGRFDVERAKRAVEEAIARRPRARFRVIGHGPPLCRTLVAAPAVDGVGWTTLVPVEGAAPVARPARAEATALDNGIVRAEIDGRGSVTLEHLATGAVYPGLLALEDDADAGDEYNYSPPEGDLPPVGEPAEPPVVEEGLGGPVEASLRVTRRYRIPVGLAADGRRRARRTTWLPVTTELALRTGEPFLRATIEVWNDAGDHRLRALFPLGFEAERSHADGAFHVTERGLAAEGGPHEHGLATYPCRRWVDASDGARGLAVLHRGTPEYELVGGGALAVTLLRCVGWLSRQGMRYRAGPAGPALRTPGAQLPGAHRFELAIFPHDGDWRAVPDVAEAFAYPLRAGGARGSAGALPPAGGALTIEPPAVQLSALGRTAEGIECRVYNASDDAVGARVRVRAPLPSSRARLVGLLGQPLGEARVSDGVVELPLRPWEVATVELS